MKTRFSEKGEKDLRTHINNLKRTSHNKKYFLGAPEASLLFMRKPMYPVSVIEELNDTIHDLRIDVAINETLYKIEGIRRKILLDEVMKLSTLKELNELQKRYPNHKEEENKNVASPTS